MYFVLAVVTFCATLLQVYAKCPTGMISNPSNAATCYSLQSNPTTNSDAEKFRQKLGGHLTSIHNIFDNMFLADQASLTFVDNVDGMFWLGLNQSSKIWIWSDGTSFDFADWDKGQPENLTGNNCGAAMMGYGKWHSVNCDKRKPFICMILNLPSATTTTTVIPTTKISTTTIPLKTTATSKPKTCQPTWTFFGHTKFCYKVFDNATWQNAEDKCKTFGAHLTSVHSWEEANFLANLSYYQAPVHQCAGDYEGWIGGYTEDQNIHWKWTDGTPFDYQAWGTNEPDNPGVENCLQMLVSSNCNGRGRYNNYKCDANDFKFICKISPS